MNTEHKCEYPGCNCTIKVEWHHPIESDNSFGVNLCQRHHSVIPKKNGSQRIKVYNDETETIKEQYEIVRELIYAAVRKAGHEISEIDKG